MSAAFAAGKETIVENVITTYKSIICPQCGEWMSVDQYLVGDCDCGFHQGEMFAVKERQA